MGGVGKIAVRLKSLARHGELLGRPPQVAGNESDFRVSDHAARTGEWLLGFEGAHRPFQQELGLIEIAELCHGNPAQGERRRIVTEGD